MLKLLLKEQKEVIGTWCILPSPEVVDLLTKTGLDFVIVDMEHGAIDLKTAQQMITASQTNWCNGLIRVPKNLDYLISTSLDTGCNGIIVPHVKQMGDVEKIIKAAKYHPIGDRGFSPYIRGGDFGKMKDEKSTDVINQESIVGIIIEDEWGLRNIESIIDNEFIDLVYVGTYDIAQTLGKSANHKDVFKILEKTTKIIRDSNKSVGCLFHSKNELKKFQSIGVNFLTYGVDTKVLYDSFHQIAKWR